MEETQERAVRRLHGLSRPEHLLVWALRAIVLGHGECPQLERGFEKACGPMGGHALVTYHAIIKLIAMAGRRRLQVHVPGCACVSPDEEAIIGAISAAQASLDGDETDLRLRLSRLLDCDPPETLIMAAQAVGRIMQGQGAALPVHGGRLVATAPTLH